MPDGNGSGVSGALSRAGDEHRGVMDPMGCSCSHTSTSPDPGGYRRWALADARSLARSTVARVGVVVLPTSVEPAVRRRWRSRVGPGEAKRPSCRLPLLPVPVSWDQDRPLPPSRGCRARPGVHFDTCRHRPPSDQRKTVACATVLLLDRHVEITPAHPSPGPPVPASSCPTCALRVPGRPAPGRSGHPVRRSTMR